MLVALFTISYVFHCNRGNNTFLANNASPETEGLHVCDNPFASSLAFPMKEAVNQMRSGRLRAISSDAELLSTWNSHDQKRFDAFEELGCESTCVGGECGADESKFVCGLALLHSPCVVYSIGGNNQWEFELDILAKTSCHVHTFDCTGPVSRFSPPDHGRHTFHHACLVAKEDDSFDDSMVGEKWTLRTMQNKLGHQQIDLLKLDIEGFEWPILYSFPTLTEKEAFALPMQILIEVHYRTSMKKLALSTEVDFKSAADMVLLSSHLKNLGYFSAVRDDNHFCQSCTELTLIRALCTS